MLHRHPFLSIVTGAYLVFVGWLTLTPQPVTVANQALIWRALNALHRRGLVEWLDFNRLEFLANIALFVPIGMFLMLLFGARLWWLSLLTCFAMTVFIETAQGYIPGRAQDQRDLIANGLGAVIGVLLALLVTLPATRRRRREERAAGLAQ